MRDKVRWAFIKKRWYQAHKVQELENARRRKYKIEPEEIEALLTIQGHKCAICRSPNPIDVDHCHQSNRVRGMLCKPCNKVLGTVKDSPIILQAFIQYLASPPCTLLT